MSSRAALYRACYSNRAGMYISIPTVEACTTFFPSLCNIQCTTDVDEYCLSPTHLCSAYRQGQNLKWQWLIWGISAWPCLSQCGEGNFTGSKSGVAEKHCGSSVPAIRKVLGCMHQSQNKTFYCPLYKNDNENTVPPQNRRNSPLHIKLKLHVKK